MRIKKTIAAVVLLIMTYTAFSQEKITSPDGKLVVTVSVSDGNPIYSVNYNGKNFLESSPLGLVTNEGNFTKGMKFLSQENQVVNKHYSQDRIKKSEIHYQANKTTFTLENADKKKIMITFQVSNNDIAFRYELPSWGQRFSCVVEKEVTEVKKDFAVGNIINILKIRILDNYK